MATYYVGPGGSDANAGTSWALRKLTLDGAEDKPVAAGDTVYVGPGTYYNVAGSAPLLTCDQDGSDGSPITYIADITGENTDGVGGYVRLTNVQSDEVTVTSPTPQCIIDGNNKDWRTFRGFWLTGTAALHRGIRLDNDEINWIIEDCAFSAMGYGVSIETDTNIATNHTIRRCLFSGMRYYGILADSVAALNDDNNLIENCIFLGCTSMAIRYDQGGGVITNCTFYGCNGGVRVFSALSGSHTPIIVENCVFSGTNGYCFQATTVGPPEEIDSDYNTMFAVGATYLNVNAGANDDANCPALELPVLLDGFRQIIPTTLFAVAQGTNVARITGSANAASDDYHGKDRPATASKKSRGAIQISGISRDTTTKRTGDASLKLADAGRHQMYVPVDGTEITVSVYCYQEANYGGANYSQLICKQPGQADDTTTATSTMGSWQELTTTFTPSASPPYIVVELVSRNTATSGSYAVYFDDLTVT